MRYALVRVTDGEEVPAGLVGWYAASAPRRYAIVTDPAAFAEWVKEHAPGMLSACGHVDYTFERAVRDDYADAGHWVHPTTGEILHPHGVRLRTDGDIWLDVTMPDGHRWGSPAELHTPPGGRRHDGVASILALGDANRAAGRTTV